MTANSPLPNGYGCSSRFARPSSTPIRKALFIGPQTLKYPSHVARRCGCTQSYDFGIARHGAEATDKTLFTELRSFLGTPAYCSPEQAEMTGLDIDTRSDNLQSRVVSTKCLPVQFVRCQAASPLGLDEMRRIIREENPARPRRDDYHGG